MKTEILKIGICIMFFSLFGCNDCTECEKNLEQANSALNDRNSVERQDTESESSTKPYVPTQIFSDQNLNSNYARYVLDQKNENFYKIDDNVVYLTIPVTHDKLRIVDVRNVSSNSLNAIVVLLDGIGGNKTDSIPVKGKIITLIEIDKIADFPKNSLKDSLIVYVFHDNKFYSDGLELKFEECVLNLGAKYPNRLETCIQTDSIKEMNLPRESGGGILSGGGK